METFTAAKHDGHPTEIAALRGARLVTGSETEHGRQRTESRIKQLTGGDVMRACSMRQDEFEFTPVLKLLIIGNNKPGLSGVNDAARAPVQLPPLPIQARGARLEAGGEASGGMAGDPALDHREMPRLVDKAAGSARRREEHHRHVFPRAGHVQPVAGEAPHRRSEDPIPESRHEGAVRFLVEVCLRQQRGGWLAEGVAGKLREAWLRRCRGAPGPHRRWFRR